MSVFGFKTVVDAVAICKNTFQDIIMGFKLLVRPASYILEDYREDT